MARLAASDASGSTAFGASVALVDDLLVVGASFKDQPPRAGDEFPWYSAGAVYIFVADAGEPTGWREVTFFDETESAVSGGYLGMAVAARADLVVGGAPGYTPSEQVGDVGAVYVYRFAAGEPIPWVYTDLLTMADLSTQRFLGASLLLDGDTVVAGGPSTDGGRGAVYIFAIPPAP